MYHNIFYHCKPHDRFVIFNSKHSEQIKLTYQELFPDNQVVTQNRLEIQNADLVYIDTTLVSLEKILDEILIKAAGNFFEIISNELLETYLFTKEGDSKDVILEGSQLKRKGEIRHFLIKKIDNHFIYSPLKLWSQKIDTENIKCLPPESILLNSDDVLNFKRKLFDSTLKFNSNSDFSENLTRCWIVWGIPLIFELITPKTLELQIDISYVYVEQENIIVDLSKLSNALENFANVVNEELFEINLRTGEVTFFKNQELPDWTNKFIINSWRHGYFKHYYPQLCY